MPDPPVSFGDNVRVTATPETERLGLAGLSGRIYGHTTPSLTDVDVIGHATDDLALNVHIEERDTDFWFVPELLEFVDHTVGTEITLDRVPRKWTRTADGSWEESSTRDVPTKRGFLSRWFRLWWPRWLTRRPTIQKMKPGDEDGDCE